MFRYQKILFQVKGHWRRTPLPALPEAARGIQHLVASCSKEKIFWEGSKNISQERIQLVETVFSRMASKLLSYTTVARAIYQILKTISRFTCPKIAVHFAVLYERFFFFFADSRNN